MYVSVFMCVYYICTIQEITINIYLNLSDKMAAGGHFVKTFQKNNVPYRSQMARNVIKSFFTNIKNWPPKKTKVPYRSQMSRNAIESEFRTSKMADRSVMARNAIKSDFRTSKMATGGHFVKNFQKKKFHIHLKLLIVSPVRMYSGGRDTMV